MHCREDKDQTESNGHAIDEKADQTVVRADLEGTANRAGSNDPEQTTESEGRGTRDQKQSSKRRQQKMMSKRHWELNSKRRPRELKGQAGQRKEQKSEREPG
jgi:hypothetical protein